VPKRFREWYCARASWGLSTEAVFAQETAVWEVSLSDELRAEIEHLKATDPDEYEHVYEGMCRQAVTGAVYTTSCSPPTKRGVFANPFGKNIHGARL
jgi:hypothetical protein